MYIQNNIRIETSYKPSKLSDDVLSLVLGAFIFAAGLM